MSEELTQTQEDEASGALAAHGDPDSAGSDAADIERRARLQGWRPSDEFRGDKREFKSAETFLKEAEDSLPLQRRRNETLERRLEESARDNKHIIEMLRRNEESAYKRAEADLLAKRRISIQNGNEDEVDQHDRELADMRKKKDEAVKVPPPAPEMPEDVREFIRRNPMFQTDQDFNRAATRAENALMVSRPELSQGERLREVERRMRRQFPECYDDEPEPSNRQDNARRNNPSAVSRGNPAPAQRSNAKTYESLPADARAVCDSQVRKKLCTRDEYVKFYYEKDA